MKALKQHCATHFQVDASSSSGGHPQLYAPLSGFNPSLPLLDPPAASGSLQSPEDSEDALEGDAVEAADTLDPETNDFRDGENIDIEDNADLHEGIILDWDVLAKEFIVEAEGLGKSEHALLHTP